jgi:peptidoglycan/xylan/chitin deacetylase (PgdA/CDA1 family)
VTERPADRPSSTGRRAFLTGAIALTAAACSARGAARDAAGAGSTTSSTPGSTAAGEALPPFVANGRRERQEVALTFHTNGDRALADRLLAVVKEHDAPITAFIVGTWLESNRDFATKALAAGHELANHTYTHLTFPKLDRATMTAEITRCRDVLEAVTGGSGRWFRPSGTSNGTDRPSSAVLDVAAAAGYSTVVGFDVDPADYQDPGAKAIETRTMDAVQPGSIVSLHFGHEGTLEALPAILSALEARNLRPVTVGALLGP